MFVAFGVLAKECRVLNFQSYVVREFLDHGVSFGQWRLVSRRKEWVMKGVSRKSALKGAPQ